jgi:ketosteroid isomerase-like protein
MGHGAARLAWLGCLCFGVSFGITAAVHAQTTPVQPQGDVKAEVEAREQQWWAGLKANDTAAIRDLMAPDFVLIYAGVFPSKDVLEAVAKFHLFKNQVSNLTIHVTSADAAWSTAHVVEAFSASGEPDHHLEYDSLTVWARQKNRWMMQARSETNLIDLGSAPAK